MINATQVRIHVDGAALEGEISSGFSFNNGLVEVTTKPTDSFKEFISGIKSASFNFDALFSSIPNLLIVGNTYQIRLIGETSAFDGDGIVESVEVAGGVDDVVKYSGTISVTGDLERLEAMLIDGSICFGSDTLCFGSDTLTGPYLTFDNG